MSNTFYPDFYNHSFIKNFFDSFPSFDIDLYKSNYKSLNSLNTHQIIEHFLNNQNNKNSVLYNSGIIYIYNVYHLGDHVFNIILFNKIGQYLIDNNLIIYYYCLENYHKQINEFIIFKNNIILKSIHHVKNGIEAWINNTNLMMENLQLKIGLDTFYIAFYNQLLNKIGIPRIVLDLQYEDNDLLDRYNHINHKFNDKYKDLDILFINSQPLSGQYNYNINDWNNFIIHKKKKQMKIVTTLKVHSLIPCTMDDSLSIKDIAAISTHCKYIIAINTGPFVGCYNKYTLEKVEKIYIFVNNIKYDHYKIICMTNINDVKL